MRDINISPCRWHLRIWDVDNNEWLCEHDDDALPYYGFDIRGGEVTAIQGMRGVYNAFAHGKEFIWEQSTGLKDKNGKEIYVGDIVSEHNGDIVGEIIQKLSGEYCIAWIGIYGGSSVLYDELSMCEVIGNIHENPELLKEEE